MQCDLGRHLLLGRGAFRSSRASLRMLCLHAILSDDGFQIAARIGGAVERADIQQHVADLARSPVRAMMQVAAEYDRGANTGVQTDQHEVLGRGARRSAPRVLPCSHHCRYGPAARSARRVRRRDADRASRTHCRFRARRRGEHPRCPGAARLITRTTAFGRRRQHLRKALLHAFEQQLAHPSPVCVGSTLRGIGLPLRSNDANRIHSGPMSAQKIWP